MHADDHPTTMTGTVCHDSVARPPIPPISGGSTDSEGNDVVLQSSDGTRFGAFSATTGRSGGSGVVILPDVRGLHPFYKELAERFAEAGVHATAIDYYGRTAGIGGRGDDFEYRPHREQTKPDQIAQDVAAAVSHLRSPEGGEAERTFTVGFCFGGRNSFNQAARGHGLTGVLGFYGITFRIDPNDTNAPVDLAPQYSCPVLGLFGGADEAVGRDHVDAFRRALDDAGVPNQIIVYDGAPHSFFDRTFARYRTECEDAWKRVLGFLRDPG